MNAITIKKLGWKYAVLVSLIFGSFIGVLMLAPIAQKLSYHLFADTRTVFGIPNGLDVLSNIPFLIIGLLGTHFCLRTELGPERYAWIVLFAGIGLVGGGSAYYHWNPNNETLVWDRLPMTIGFMGLFAALLGEYVHHRLSRLLLAPSILIGLATVLYWHWADDLRFYIWVQLIPLLLIPTVMLMFRPNYSHSGLLLGALGWYALAKVTEVYDVAIFDGTQQAISGHSIKHLLAAMGCYSILLMLKKRRPYTGRQQSQTSGI